MKTTGHTMISCLLSVFLFIIFLYVVAPIIENIIDFFGKLTGFYYRAEGENRGILNTICWSIVTISVCSYFSLSLPVKWLSATSIKTLCVFFSLFSVIYAAIFVFFYAQTTKESLLMFLITFPAYAVPLYGLVNPKILEE